MCVYTVIITTLVKSSLVKTYNDEIVYYYIHIISLQPQCPVVGRRPQHAVSTSPYLTLSSANSALSILVCFVSPLSRRSPLMSFPFVGFPCPRNVHQLSRFLLTCPAHVHSWLLSCQFTSVTCVFFLSQRVLFLSWYMMFNILLSVLFVRLLSHSLPA